jgi:hypothetical protein
VLSTPLRARGLQFQVDRSTITRALGETGPLLADRGCRI